MIPASASMRRFFRLAAISSLANVAGVSASSMAAICGERSLSGGHLRGFERSSSSASISNERPDQFAQPKRLGVILPATSNNLKQLVESIRRWPIPMECSTSTLQHADLVLYYAEDTNTDDTAYVLPYLFFIEQSAGRCFAHTRIVFADLSNEEKVYPQRVSAQFYKLFLDTSVSAQLSEYDALAIIEHDVRVVYRNSFAQLYREAFCGIEEFWVKGSVVEEGGDMWHAVGHINRNAIYNNDDPAFVEYVEYARARWGDYYPYDVALWATISDFPYSWQLWQKYSSKFLVANLISNGDDGNWVNINGITNTAFWDQAPFVVQASISERSAESAVTATSRRNLYTDEELFCGPACGTDMTGLPNGTSTVCDVSCTYNRFGGFLCGAGHGEKYGGMCRLCYVDKEEAIKAERQLRDIQEAVEFEDDFNSDYEAEHVIMCDTMRPPTALECSEKCGQNRYTVCDDSCGSGRYGDYNCNWLNAGSTCRFCFEDVETALMADKVAIRRGGRVIMCDTLEPPRRMGATDEGSDEPIAISVAEHKR